MQAIVFKTYQEYAVDTFTHTSLFKFVQVDLKKTVELNYKITKGAYLRCIWK